jgi:1L-myo-inositol 1-phosphate cytidylyltransferase / CDP-L-myo-inositol myo-inositolphosphotransferase
MESENVLTAIQFATAAEANRRVAGVAAAARAVRARSEAGAGRIALRIGDGAPLAPATLADIERLRGRAAVAVEAGPVEAGERLRSSWAVVRATGKAGDGLVSRFLNRPISQRITWLLLRLPGARPVHVTIFNAMLALVMVTMLFAPGGTLGLVLGGILFHAASVLDGVDGEMARATWRASPFGATLDSAVDLATNFLFLAGVTAHLALRDGDAIGWIGGWAIFIMVTGLPLMALRLRADGAPLGFDILKRSGRLRGPVDLVYWIVQTLSSRDTYAFLFMVLIVVGLERTALFIFTGVATLWFAYLLATLYRRSGRRTAGFRGAA